MASGDTLSIFTARDGVPTATVGAVQGILAGVSTPAEGVPTLGFDSATDESVDFIGILPRAYAGGGLTLTLQWASGVTSGAVVWNAAFRRVADDAEDITTTSYDYATASNAVTATTASAAGEVDYAAITFSDGADMDSLAVGELFILRITRDANNGSDDMTGDALLIAIEIKET